MLNKGTSATPVTTVTGGNNYYQLNNATVGRMYLMVYGSGTGTNPSSLTWISGSWYKTTASITGGTLLGAYHKSVQTFSNEFVYFFFVRATSSTVVVSNDAMSTYDHPDLCIAFAL